MTPYNTDKDLGGDSEENVKWMEQCVMRVMKTGKDKGNAVAICKATLKKKKGNTKEASLFLDKLLNLLSNNR